MKFVSLPWEAHVGCSMSRLAVEEVLPPEPPLQKQGTNESRRDGSGTGAGAGPSRRRRPLGTDSPIRGRGGITTWFCHDAPLGAAYS